MMIIISSSRNCYNNNRDSGNAETCNRYNGNDDAASDDDMHNRELDEDEHDTNHTHKANRLNNRTISKTQLHHTSCSSKYSDDRRPEDGLLTGEHVFRDIVCSNLCHYFYYFYFYYYFY